MTVFNQQGQSVTNQYNVGGDMHFGTTQQAGELTIQIKNLLDKVEQLVNTGQVDVTLGNEATQALQQAATEIRKPDGKKTTVTAWLSRGAEILKGATAASTVVSAIKELAEHIARLFV